MKVSLFITFFIIFAIFAIIFILLNIKKRRNINRKEEQLEYFLLSLSGNLFIQPNILNCIKNSINEIGEPLKNDFMEVLENYSRGLVFKDALRIMIKKNDSKLIEVVLSGFIAASEKGTDISKFINYQIEYIREKKSLKNYINILSTGPRYSSYFIMFIPIISILVITLINENFISYYLSGLGIIISIYAIGSFLIGFLLINKTINNLGKNILIS
ncbi:MAG: type II secretion system F family protein [Actinomycetota bacterium]|nr:type II secretion system F family protein [Actinomycetota bacterium]